MTQKTPWWRLEIGLKGVSLTYMKSKTFTTQSLEKNLKSSRRFLELNKRLQLEEMKKYDSNDIWVAFVLGFLLGVFCLFIKIHDK
jgi:hypothetical protein